MKKLLFVLAIAAVGFNACSKEEAKDPIVGYWKGTEIVSANVVKNNAFVINADGTLKYYYMDTGTDTSRATIKANGSYTLTNSVFKAYIYQTDGLTIRFSYTATANGSVTKLLNGTWGRGTSFTDGGAFAADKQ
jgi:hypothetical protein